MESLYNLMEMLSSLDDLAGKVSPGSGKDSPQHFDNNANAAAAAAKLRHLNHIVHPYSRQDAANNHAAKEKWVSLSRGGRLCYYSQSHSHLKNPYSFFATATASSPEE